MKVIRVLNNNVVQAIGEDGKELVLMGKGIAFNSHGGNIDQSKIQKIFTLNSDQLTSQISAMFELIPEEYWNFGTKVTDYIEEKLDIDLNINFYFALVDHIYVSVERYKQNIMVPDIFSAETKYVFPEVYQIALDVVGMMKEEYGFAFSESEAGFISLHIIDAETDITNVRDSKITLLSNEILQIVKTRLNVTPSNENINGTRFLIHLKYLANRIVSGSPINNKDLYEAIYKNLIRDFPKQHGTVLEIVNSVRNKYQFEIGQDEQCYLLIHLIKLTE